MFQGLPGELRISAASHLKRFQETYGEFAAPKEFYKLQQIWIRFAPVWPRITFLLDSLIDIHENLDELLYQFEIEHFTNKERLSPGRTPFRSTDLFSYFGSRLDREDQRRRLMLTCSALRFRDQGLVKF